MWNAKLFIFSLVALTGLGCCHPRSSRTMGDFAFIQASLSTQVLTNRLGPPDRLSGREVVFMEYDLSDGSKMVVLPSHPTEVGDYYGPIYGAAHARGTN